MVFHIGRLVRRRCGFDYVRGVDTGQRVRCERVAPRRDDGRHAECDRKESVVAFTLFEAALAPASSFARVGRRCADSRGGGLAWEHTQQEAADEFAGGQGRHLAPVTMGVVLVAKAHVAVETPRQSFRWPAVQMSTNRSGLV